MTPPPRRSFWGWGLEGRGATQAERDMVAAAIHARFGISRPFDPPPLLEDIRGRAHEHLPLGEGEIDFPPVLRALAAAGYGGLVTVELSRNSHDAPE